MGVGLVYLAHDGQLDRGPHKNGTQPIVFGTAIAEVASFPLSVASARKRLSAAQFVREIL
jgi:hypothetical protein